MFARIKCAARKVLHALNVSGQWVAVEHGFMLASDVDRSKAICPTVKSDDNRQS